MITAIIPTSPRPSHPSTQIIDRTIASLRASIPDVKIVVTCDGGTSEEFIHRLQADRVISMSQHVHQSGMLVEASELSNSELLFYCEDDWEILPQVPWKELSELILSKTFNVIKLHATPRISPFHEHLMEERIIYQNGVGRDRYDDAAGGVAVPIIKTRQWSQNPHLASTDFYRNKILPLVSGKCDFIENIVHGIIGNSRWEDFKCGIYNPPSGDMMRVFHLDGRNSQ